MGKIQLIQEGFNAIKQCSKNKIVSQELRLTVDSKASALIDEFVSTTAKKKVSQSDIINFRQYLLGKEVDIKITPEEIKTLFACKTDEEFGVSASEFLTKKMQISDKLKPQYLCAEINPNAKMAYDYSQNIIFVNPNAQFADRAEFLSLLRHELQHYKQNICIFRHPEIGNKAVNLYAKLLSNAQVKNIDNQIRNCSIEELKNLGYPEEILQKFSKAKGFLNKNQTAEYEKFIQKFAKEIETENLKLIDSFRAGVVDEFGLLTESSREAGRAKKYFEATARGNGYFQKDGGIDYGKYLFDIRENEAIVAQDMISLRIKENHSCYPKALNEAQKLVSKMSGQDKVMDDIKKHVEKQNTKGVTFKDIISYLFD